MIDQPDFSRYQLRFTSVVPLDRRHVEPDEDAFERHDIELIRFDEETGESVKVATAIAFHVRFESRENLVEAADAEPDSPLLEAVCTGALDPETGEILPKVAAALGDVMTVGVLVLDRIAFERRQDDAPVLRGLLARGVLEHLGRVGSVLFLPREDAILWEQAVGAKRAGRFVVASADFVLPEFPLGVVQVGEA